MAGLNILQIVGFIFPFVLLSYLIITNLRTVGGNYKRVYLLIVTWVLLVTVLKTLNYGFGGIQSLSGAMERGHDMLYICYDNEAYMNTGIQRSGATPFAADTKTAPVGTKFKGKQQYNKNLTPYAKKLRKNLTTEEVKIWAHVRKRQILDVKFLRQRPILNFIVDFFAPEIELAIEIDGSQHYFDQGKYQDNERDAALNKLGIIVLRYSNADINMRFDSVMRDLYQNISSRL